MNDKCIYTLPGSSTLNTTTSKRREVKVRNFEYEPKIKNDFVVCDKSKSKIL